MLKQLLTILIATSLLLVGRVYAQVPDVIMVFTPSDETGATLLYAGNDAAPPPIVVVRGEIVGSDSHGNGGPDCGQTPNKPACQTLEFVNELDACGGPPDIIVIGPDGHGAYITCEAFDGSPPPLVIVNGEVVGQYD